MLALLITACRREERDFRNGGPSPAATTSLNVVPRNPGLMPRHRADTTWETNAFALSDGKRLYGAFNCTGCHANGGGDFGPALMDANWIYGAAPEDIYTSILEGRPNGMPAFRGKISRTQAWQIAAYVRSLSGQVNPNAAPGRDDHAKASPPENSMDREKPKIAPAPP